MQRFIRYLRKLGAPFNFIGTALAYLTTNWVVVVSLLLGVASSIWGFLFSLASNQKVQVGAGVFLFSVWTLTAFRILASLNKPIVTQPKIDIRHSINVEGYDIGFDENNHNAAFQIAVKIRNSSNYPIKLKAEKLVVKLDDRICPDAEGNVVIIPRVGVRGIRSGTFKRDALKDENIGEFEFVMLYGDADGEFSRKFSTKNKLYINIVRNEKGKVAGFQVVDEIIETSDVAI